ncbi:potassium channel subfamily K member 1 [Thalassophryne amazonica]|uniref:potassium channel subfamily K member 1 n=1 Tax=Thalassophryne amazonica TaxID=390379 RepID=UPI001470DC41|nr:potassium channel subfamily K member 1 [Thalassophryne amazonica]
MPSPALFLRANALAFLVCGYVLFVLLGALVFRTLEMPVEKRMRAEMEELHHSFLQENPCMQDGKLSELLGEAVTAHRRDVAVLQADGEERSFGFTSALYFIMVTLTTMGSDSFSPMSDQVKLFFIVYCSLGIPLTLFLLTLLSDLLLPFITSAPIHYLHKYWSLSYNRAALVHVGLLLGLLLVVLFLCPALMFRLMQPEWSFLDALFFCFAILSTVGPGSSSVGRSWVPGTRETLELITTCYLLVSLVVIFTFKETVLRVSQVRTLIRFFVGPQFGQLEGLHLNQLTLSGQSFEEPRYSLSICTVSSAQSCSNHHGDTTWSVRTTSCLSHTKQSTSLGTTAPHV